MNSLTKETVITPLSLKLLLICGFLLVLPHIANLKPEFIVISLALLTWRAITLKFPQYIPNKWLLLPLSILLALFILKNFGMSFGRDASSSLLIVLLALKLLECRKSRDVIATVFIGFFVLITPFLFDQSIILALYSVCIFLLLLLTLLINTTGQKTLQSFTLFRLSATILLQAIPLMLIGFLLFPRMIGPLWALPDDASNAVSGISDTINPGQISNLALSSATAFRVTFEGEPPEQKNLYWRGPVFYETDGIKWQYKGNYKTAGKLTHSVKPIEYKYTVIMEPHHQTWLYSLDLPNHKVANSKLSEDRQLMLSKKLGRTLSYTLTSSNASNTKLTDTLKKRSLNLPKNTSDNILSLAENFRKNSSNDLETVNKALQHFNQQDFFYTLKPPLLGKNPNDEFLFKTKQGFCSHYASAFTVLMRAANIPARIIAGYQGGIHNTLGGFWEIRQADAHVWVEVWLKNSGWTRVDPTAAIAPERILNSINLAEQLRVGEVRFNISRPDGFMAFTQQAKWLLNTIDYYWQSGVLAYGPENQAEFLNQAGIKGWEDMVKWLTIFSIGFLLLLIIYLNFSKKTKPDKAQQILLSFCKHLSKRYGEKHPYETVSDYFDRVKKQNSKLTTSLNIINQNYLNCRYGRADIEPFKKSVKAFNESLIKFK